MVQIEELGIDRAERSLFAENFGLRRQIGAMLWGQFDDYGAEYAIGVFDGPRSSLQDYNSAKDVAGFLNFTPFRQAGENPLKNLNFGGSFSHGVQNNPLTPAVLRTNTNASSTSLDSTAALNNATVPFLAFNPGVREIGPRELFELHLAYYYQGLSLISTWNAGSESYAAANGPITHVPISGYSVAAAYLITGEVVNQRTLVDPISRFDLRPGQRGLGALEPFCRYSTLNLSDKVFTNGIADPTQWTNRVNMVDVGLNWYLNAATKVDFDWEHAMFGQPVTYGTAANARTNDLFWLRVQLFF